MKKKWQTFLSIALYIIILTCSLDFNILKLIDVRLILLVLSGTLILTLPFYEKGIPRKELVYIFGRKAIDAGFIQTFLLLFARLQNAKGYDELLSDISLCFRPLLYGFCLTVLLCEKAEPEPKTASGNSAGCESCKDRKTEELSANNQNSETLHIQDFVKMYRLTKRETEIAQLILQGKSNGEIAGELFISETTVKKHVSNIFEKTGINRREELIIKVRRE